MSTHKFFKYGEDPPALCTGTLKLYHTPLQKSFSHVPSGNDYLQVCQSGTFLFTKLYKELTNV